ncbi:hypothetical protein [Streptomyces sp. NPDC005408]|uniref:hypothetical protein n=1 Tax=Streptomyces sp. NPDC005408 TaxID=3155341 RepID=UPI0033B0CA91
MPVPTNRSNREIEIANAKILDIPSGLEVIGYGAYSLEDADGLLLLGRDNDRFTPKYRELRDYSKGGFTVKAKALSDIFYVAHLRVAGDIQENATECRFEYRQGGVAYTQTLGCELELRVKK